VGFPVTLKVASPDIIHKSDIKGVLLDLKDEKSVIEGYKTVINNAHTTRPQAEILGVYVQPMIYAGQEVIIGAIQDPQFGPLVMFGSGGVEVEGLEDVSFAWAPMTLEEAHYMLDSTWAGRKLRGYRDIIPADVPAVIQVLLRLAQLSADFPQLTEVEINPLRVFGKGTGVIALDARIRVTN
jgi:acetyltransferase